MAGHGTKGTALITGASAGIGAAYAERLAARGYDLILVARDEARLNGLAEKLRGSAEISVAVLKADLNTRSGQLLVEKQLRTDQTLTMLVNNAGIAVAGSATETDVERLTDMVEINVMALMRLAVAAASNLAAQGRGAIINIASVGAFQQETAFQGGGTVYGATKAFVVYLSQALHFELESKGVRVQAVLPGATRTEIWERSGIDIAQVPPTMLMEVDEMADAALAGFDQKELVTIPALPDKSDWDRFNTARQALLPNLSRNHAADRYKTKAP